MKKQLMLVVLCLCLVSCGTFDVQVKVLPTATAMPIATNIPTATATLPPTAVPTASPTHTRMPELPFMLASIQMNDTSSGWGVDTLGRIVHTDNGGRVWVDVTPSEEPFARHSLFAFSDKLAWVASSQFETSHLVWRTLNGGTSWKSSAPIPLGDGSYRPLRLQFPDVNNGWMLVENEAQAGNRVLLYASTDGGANWAQVDTISAGMVRAYLPATTTSMAFLDGKQGWLGGDWEQGEWLMLKTGDGGENWGTDTFRLPTEQKGVTCDGYAVSEMEPGAMAVDVICTKAKDAKYLFHHIYYLSKNTGPIWHSWPIPGKVLSMDFANANQGWMLVTSDDLQSNRVLSTRDGGDTWRVLAKVTWRQAQLNFVTDKIGWAITDSGFGLELFRTEDTGKTWIQVRPSLNQ